MPAEGICSHEIFRMTPNSSTLHIAVQSFWSPSPPPPPPTKYSFKGSLEFPLSSCVAIHLEMFLKQDDPLDRAM